MTTMELQQAVELELAENPALEVPDEDACESCDQPRSMCVDCPFYHKKNSEDDVDLSIYEVEQSIDFAADAEENTDFISNIRETITLADHLTQQMHALIDKDKWDIGEYIISNITDSGYLECPIEEIVIQTGRDFEEIEEVIGAIQGFDPPGVGARDLRECVVIQLTRLAEDGAGNDIALRIATDYWTEMITGKIGKVARKLKVSAHEISTAIDFIREQLNPYPGNSFRPPFDNDPSGLAESVKPDAKIKRTPAGFEVEVNDQDQYFIMVNPRYRMMYEEIKNGGEKKYNKDDKAHIVQFVERAELFMKNINERRRTLRNITRTIIDYQQGFLETGSKAFMRPLTRTKVAQIIGVHESTVSRATASKYVQLPTEEVVPYEIFFDGATNIKDIICDLIAAEDKTKPLSDQQIAEILKERGFDVARRTVVKYREAEKILSSRQRRR